MTMVDFEDESRVTTFPESAESTDLLKPVFRGGEAVYENPPLEAVRERTAEELRRFHGDCKRLRDPGRYPVGLERELHGLKTELARKAKEI